MAGAGALWHSGRPNESALAGKCQDGFPLPKE